MKFSNLITVSVPILILVGATIAFFTRSTPVRLIEGSNIEKKNYDKNVEGLFLNITYNNLPEKALKEIEKKLLSTAPYYNEESILCANYSKETWVLSVLDGRINFEKHDAYRKQSLFLKTTSGDFYGEDLGEWGGSLTIDYNDRLVKILEKGIKSIFEVQPGFVVIFSGLNHLSIDEGEVTLLTYSNDSKQWSVLSQFDLGESPYAVFMFNAEVFYYVSRKGLRTVNIKTKVIELIKATELHSVFPNSLIVDKENNVYVGMRHAIGFWDYAKNYQETWYVSKRCATYKDLEPIYE